MKTQCTVNVEIRAKSFAAPEEIEELILSLLYADDRATVYGDPRAFGNIVTRLDESFVTVLHFEVSLEKT